VIGTTVSHFRILERLGEGGMGVVYRAQDLKLDREVALKFLMPDRVRDRDARARFIREARAASALDHPNICTIHAVEETGDGRLFIVMACYAGETVKARLERGPLAVDAAAGIAAQAARGLAKAHRLGIVHRDIKPANLMVTEDGLVKLLDFGIAKLADATEVTRPGSVLGTTHYMAPEQLEGEAADRRSDLWSLGVVLYEMLTGEMPFGGETVAAVMSAILTTEPPPLRARRQDVPAELAGAVERCLSKRMDARFAAAEDLARSLDRVGGHGEALAAHPTPGIPRIRHDTAEIRPYPGLESFTARDAAFFHGREAQVEAQWQKLRRHRLLAVTGPSGVGKTSFLRAGLIPARPRGWGVIVVSPRGAPLLALREALVTELGDDAAALRSLLREHDHDATVDGVRRWRWRHDEALIVIDQFEELFTLSPPAEQAAFTDLLSRLTFEADAHVLLSLRDDFLVRCRQHSGLAPVFESLTVLLPLAGPDLRRALVQPARDCGYGFEDDALVATMLAEAAGERGALPLLAFAMAQLWEQRDRDRGLITREAYAAIGEVGGALARHAEAVLERIGPARLDMVREIFRNLVTAEGTRAIADRQELLSVFAEAERAAAAAVLDKLVAARLLTSFEARAQDGRDRCRVEIVHESLLTAWPRLVRWRTQDADGAQLRDQLRQAAQLWEQRSRSDDLLWTGTALREFALWRERYPGGLSASEDAFARAMMARATRRRRRRRLAIAAGFSAAALVLVVVSGLWRQAEHQARRAEARRLQLLAAEQLPQDNTLALALAVASLEQEDTPRARELAVAALGAGPTRFVLPLPDTLRHARSAGLSADGRWLATCADSAVVLWPATGSRPRRFSLGAAGRGLAIQVLEFLPGRPALAGLAAPPGPAAAERLLATLWSVPAGDVIARWDVRVPPGTANVLVRGEPPRLLVAQRDRPYEPLRWLACAAGDSVLAELGRPGTSLDRHFATDAAGRWLLDSRGPDLALFSLDSLATGSERLVGRHDGQVCAVALATDGRLAAASDRSRAVRVWSLDEPPRPARCYRTEGVAEVLCLSASSRLLAAKERPGGRIAVYDLEHPADLPLHLLAPREGNDTVSHAPAGFSADERWLVAPVAGRAEAWFYGLPPRGSRNWRFWPEAEPAAAEPPRPVALSLAGGWLLAVTDGGQLWRIPLWDPQPAPQLLFESPSGVQPWLYVTDREGRLLLCTDPGRPRAYLIPLDGRPARELNEVAEAVTAVALDPDGRLAAVGGWTRDLPGAPRRTEIVVRDLRTDGLRRLAPGHDARLYGLWFVPGDRLLSASEVGLRLWDLRTGGHEVLNTDCHLWNGAVDAAGRLFVGENPRRAILWDLAARTARELPIAAEGLACLVISSDGRHVVAGRAGGEVHFLPLDASAPHILPGHGDTVWAVSLAADGQTIVSAAADGTVRRRRVPRGQPLQTQPLSELLATIRGRTNVRAVGDVDAAAGYRLRLDPFPGWASPPVER